MVGVVIYCSREREEKYHPRNVYTYSFFCGFYPEGWGLSSKSTRMCGHEMEGYGFFLGLLGVGRCTPIIWVCYYRDNHRYG